MGEVLAVLVAGGKGSRMFKLLEGKPKALLQFGTVSLLAHHLQILHAHGITRGTILVGQCAELIRREMHTARPRDMSVDLITEPIPAGSGGCLRYLPTPRNPLLVIFADVMANLDYATLIKQHRSTHALITVVVHPNDHPADSDLVETNASNQVTALRRKPRPHAMACRNLAVAGIFVLEPEALSRLPTVGHCDLVHDLLVPAIEGGCQIFAYRTTEYVKDCGTPERYACVKDDYKSGRIFAEYRTNLRPTLFIDRDGTVNSHVGYVTYPEQLELLPGSAAAIRRLNHAGILAVLVTNQPIVARGECSAEVLESIHARLEMLLGAEGAFLDGIFVCPHHPDRGYLGEVAELKFSCDCRKPEPGLVLRAARELPVDLTRSAVVGDSERDVALAQRINLPAFHISSREKPMCGVTYVRDLSEAVDQWLNMVRQSNSTNY